ncbi:helix-turn-helix domain-containing protein [Kitasatospora sp. NPDC002227]|uniref:helix-turn-helix domain-containing protein n=1 Tax=Kitasatospora sp. NPDC002227 TaxID=3154773 RepID=UPI0033302DD3
MPTLGWLVTTVPGLRLVDGPPEWVERPVLGLAEPGEDPTGQVLVYEPGVPGLRRAAAIAVRATGPDGPFAGVPVLRVAPEVSWLRVSRAIADERLREAQAVADRRWRVARERAERLEQLLAHAREPGDRAVERVVEWLGQAVRGTALLAGPATAAQTAATQATAAQATGAQAAAAPAATGPRTAGRASAVTSPGLRHPAAGPVATGRPAPGPTKAHRPAATTSPEPKSPAAAGPAPTGLLATPEPGTGGQVLAVSSPAAPDLLAAGRGPGAEIAAGRLRSAALEEDGLSLRLAAVGRGGAHLTVGRAEPFDQAAAALVGQTAGVLAALLRLRAAEQRRDRLAEAAAGLRVAVFQLLMGGEVTLAQRTAEGLAPGLLDTERARVYILEGPAEERDELARACGGATAGRAMVVRCPATEQHLIVISPLPARSGSEPGWDAVGQVLRGFLEHRADRFLGGSGVQPLAEVAGAYGDAVRSLAVARLRPGRAALYAVESRLTEVFDPAVAGAWAAGVLGPLRAVPLGSRDQLLGTLRLGLEFPATSAGKILGVSRNTVRARMDRAAALLGLDLDKVRPRAVLHLALRAEESGAAAEAAGVTLAEVLGTPAVRAWATGLLQRLGTDARGLRTTLRTWLAVDTHVERTAQELGLHPQTVREHLRAAEQLLQRQLLSGGSGVYETALAFAALSELDPALEGN